jgi:hypothetical protein
MKASILKDSKVGATIGFILAIIYMTIILIIAELSLPISDSSEIMIFTNESLSLYIEAILIASPIWLLTPVLIGCITTIFMSFVLASFHFSKSTFLFVCFAFCLAVTLLIYLPFQDLILFQIGLSDIGFGANKYFMLFGPSVGLITIITPGLIYLIAGLIVGDVRYNQINSL